MRSRAAQLSMQVPGTSASAARASSRQAASSWRQLAQRQRQATPGPCRASYNTETMPPPIPPPPPPPPPPPTSQALGRRELLQVAAFGGAGLLAGVVLGRTRAAGGMDGAVKAQIDQLRAESRFKRDYEGHVFVQARDGSWFEVKPDAKLPGTLLLRDPDGFLYTKTVDVQQVDLSEDYVVAAVFGDGAWETTLAKVQGKDEEGRLVDAVLDEDSFRDFISITE